MQTLDTDRAHGAPLDLDRLPPNAELWAYRLAWLGGVLVPWVLLSWALRAPLTSLSEGYRSLLAHPSAVHLLLPRPFGGLALIATCTACAALTVALGLSGKLGARRPRRRAPWVDGAWAIASAAPAWAALALCGLGGLAVRQSLPGLPQTPLGTLASQVTCGVLGAAAVLAPCGGLLAWRRRLRRRFGRCRLQGRHAVFRPLGLVPWTAVVPARALDRRRPTPHGVQVRVPGCGWLLIPCSRAVTVLARLDRPRPRAAAALHGGRARVDAALLATALVAVAVLRLGVGWALPAAAVALALLGPGALAWSRGRRRAAGVLVALGGVCGAWLALTPWPVYRVTVARDRLDNSVTVVRRLGDRHPYVILGGRPATVLAPGARLTLPDGDPGCALDLTAHEARAAGRPPQEVLPGARLFARAIDGTWRAEWRAPDWLADLVEAGAQEEGDPTSWPLALGWASSSQLVRDFAGGVTSRAERVIEGPGGPGLHAWLEGGEVRYVFLVERGGYAPHVELHDGELQVALGPRHGWGPGEPGKVVWIGPGSPWEQGAQAFSVAPPSLEELEAIAAAVDDGATLEAAGRAALPFWDLEAVSGVSRATQRELGLALRTEHDPPRGFAGYALSSRARSELSAQPAHDPRSSYELEALELRHRLALDALSSPVAATRLRAARQIYGLSVTQAGYDAVTLALQDETPEVRRVALSAAHESYVHCEFPPLHRRLVRALRDPAREVREEASLRLHAVARSALRTSAFKYEAGPGAERVLEAHRSVLVALLEELPPDAPLARDALLVLRRGRWNGSPGASEALRARLRALIGAAPDVTARWRLEDALYGAGERDRNSGVRELERWIGRRQQADGRWSADDPRDDLTFTAHAVLTYLAHGQTQRAGPYKRTVRRGLEWLIAHEVDASSATPRERALRTYALTEALAVSRDRDFLTEPCRAALDDLERLDVARASARACAYALLAVLNYRSLDGEDVAGGLRQQVLAAAERPWLHDPDAPALRALADLALGRGARDLGPLPAGASALLAVEVRARDPRRHEWDLDLGFSDLRVGYRRAHELDGGSWDGETATERLQRTLANALQEAILLREWRTREWR